MTGIHRSQSGDNEKKHILHQRDTMSCFCNFIELREKFPVDCFKPLNSQASKRLIYVSFDNRCGVNADSDFSIHCGEMRLDPKVVIATDQITDDTFTKFVSPSLPSHVVMENEPILLWKRVCHPEARIARLDPDQRRKPRRLEPFILDRQQDHDSVASRPCNGAQKEKKGTDGQLLVSLPPDVADELELQSPTRYDRTDVNGFNARIANVRQLRFRLTPVHPDV
ncbi:hypothetical protein T12_12463 [Trichinella patagoniensis]|uniref:Uncharacterized protein n=1 Tax=Trichinella patagoniensis TaxID=990121 RepID=A0A0V0ZKX5_9BILA|nr:hypothetical protein T12_12463 [Trichinella patagoniensis]